MDVWWYNMIFFFDKFHVVFQGFGNQVIKEMMVEGQTPVDEIFADIMVGIFQFYTFTNCKGAGSECCRFHIDIQSLCICTLDMIFMETSQFDWCRFFQFVQIF